MTLCQLRITPIIFLIIGFAVLTEGLVKTRYRSRGTTYGGGTSSGSDDNVGMILGIVFGSLGGIILFIVFIVFLAKCYARRRMQGASSKTPTWSGQSSKNKALGFSSTQQNFETVTIPVPDMATPPSYYPSLSQENLPAYDSAWTGHTDLPYPASPVAGAPSSEMSPPSAPPESQFDSVPSGS